MKKQTICAIIGTSAALCLSAEEPKHVIAHYMTCFGATPDYYVREIQLAKSYGIEGFALNCGEWKKPNPKIRTSDTSKWIGTYYVTNADKIFAAAQKCGDFHITMSPDFAGKMIAKYNLENLFDMYSRYYDHPCVMKYKGQVFMSGYAGTPEAYKPAVEAMAAKGKPVLCVPQCTGMPWYPMAMSPEALRRFFDRGTYLAGIGYFAADATPGDIIDGNRARRKETLFRNKICLAGISPSYNSPNRRDFQGMYGMEQMWRGIIADNPEFVEIITWNDYQEDSNLMPHRTNHMKVVPGIERDLYDREESFLDANSYFIHWFRTGTAPVIEQDRVYITSRNRSKHLTKAFFKGKWADIRFNTSPYDQLHDDVLDKVYVSAFLTAPASLEVKTGDFKKSFDLPAGLSHVNIPMKPGLPEVTLTRAGNKVLDFVHRRSITARATELNAVCNAHFVFREWTCGGAAGIPEVTFRPDPKTGEMKWDIPDALQGKTFNFRINYVNGTPGDDARLTLRLDAPGKDFGSNRCYIPVFLPYTGKEQKTSSVLYTIPEGVKTMSIAKEVIDQPHPDRGNAKIQSVELVSLKHFKPNTCAPSRMVKLSGGTFVMGKGEKNGGFKMTLSPFAMSRTEVTNAEYEKFMPEHRNRRDSFSWRDSDPVIYVSWFDAAKYCNWLSAQEKRTPAYDTKTWQLIPGANGYRLPSEAQWEYAASGRGEGRIYPWGSNAPTADLANIPPAPLNPNIWNRVNTGICVSPVGLYRKGLSRDGIADLAGNVAEWCTDTYLDYEPGDKTDFVQTKQSPHRSIRGSSFGYYNMSGKNTSREFNNPGYPGYIYIGFRIVCPE